MFVMNYDNCPDVFNPDQMETQDDDGIGDVTNTQVRKK